MVVTVRDPARQIPAEYQEGVKHGRRMSYATFLDTVLAEEPPSGDQRRSTRERFWKAQDPVAVLDRWAAHVGPEHCHVVTCPPAGAEPLQLWSRFAQVLGVGEVAVDMPPKEVNTSLGAVQIEVLRRLNRRVTRHGNERAYGDVVKRLYAGTILRGQDGERLTLPAEQSEPVRVLAEGWVSRLGERGYPVTATSRTGAGARRRPDEAGPQGRRQDARVQPRRDRRAAPRGGTPPRGERRAARRERLRESSRPRRALKSLTGGRR